MSDEVNIRSSLQIKKTSSGITLLDYNSRPTSFTGDLTGTKGPTPGAFAVSVTGTDVDLSELTTPGYCRFANQDDENFVEYGIYDPETEKFYPLGEILAGESYVLRLSRNLAWEYGTGTGTSGPETNTLRFRANTAVVSILVEAFEA